MKKVKFEAALIGLIIFTLASCATGSGNHSAQNTTALEVATILKLSDIPIPTGFRLLQNESFAFQNNELRIALFKYIGKGSTDMVSNFFKEQMPLYNWGLINIVEYGNNVLNFQRDNEVCTISVIPQGKSKSQIVISVNPRADGISSDVSSSNRKTTLVK